MPTFSKRHSKGSASPLAMAIFGMSAVLPSPSKRFLGKRELSLATALSMHEVTVGNVILRRHLPICTTRGMPAPEGTLFSVNFPSAPVWATAIAEMLDPAQVSHDAPVLK